MNRTWLFLGLVAVCVTVTVGYIVMASGRSPSVAQQAAADLSASPEVLASVVARPHVVFLYSPTGDQYRRVAVAPLDAPDQQYLTPLQCQRLYVAAEQGLCLGNNYVDGVMSSYSAYTFDTTFAPRATFDELGIPSRVRVAPDGQHGSTTLFVTGHSYSDGSFSTATTVHDLTSGTPVANLEQFTVLRDGARFEAPDFNFWGVTFARDSNRFYATLATAGKTYLVQGDLAARTLTVLREGIECPSLSPDNTKLAFKQLVPSSGPQRVWRVAVMDLATLADHLVEAETRLVDDQIEWLDDNTVVYALPDEGPPATIATNVWATPIDSSAAPRMMLKFASSPAVVRAPSTQ